MRTGVPPADGPHGTMSGLMAQYERYPASGEINTSVADVAAATAAVRGAFAERDGVVVDTLDGLTVSHPKAPMWWFNLRPSNTEPLLRLNAEAVDAATMAGVRDEVLGLIHR